MLMNSPFYSSLQLGGNEAGVNLVLMQALLLYHVNHVVLS